MSWLRIGQYEHPRIFLASGLLNFDGSGYRYHSLPPWRFVMNRLKNDPRVTFTAKTLTDGQAGNMPLLDDGITTKELFPRCIVVDPFTGHTINAVGLSCKPYQFYFERGIWQDQTRPFVISYLANAQTPQLRTDQVKRFAEAWSKYAPTLPFWPIVTLNGGCPNVEHRSAFFDEIAKQVRVLQATGSSVVVNFSPIIDTGLAGEMSFVADAEAICNTIRHSYMAEHDSVWPWGKKSPLEKRGFPEGGWSGPRCLKYTLKTVRAIRERNKKAIIIAGNGIQRPGDVGEAKRAGADAISIGILPVVRPFWPLVNSVISRASVVWPNLFEGVAA